MTWLVLLAIPVAVLAVLMLVNHSLGRLHRKVWDTLLDTERRLGGSSSQIAAALEREFRLGREHLEAIRASIVETMNPIAPLVTRLEEYLDEQRRRQAEAERKARDEADQIGSFVVDDRHQAKAERDLARQDDRFLHARSPRDVSSPPSGPSPKRSAPRA